MRLVVRLLLIMVAFEGVCAPVYAVNPLKKVKQAFSSKIEEAKQNVEQAFQGAKIKIDDAFQAAQNVASNVASNVKDHAQKVVASFQGVTVKNPYKQPGTVRVELDGGDLLPEEVEASNARLTRVADALQKLTGMQTSPDQGTTPNIALCISGGGYRAMVSAIGIVKGLKKTSLPDQTSHFDLVNYIATLSGSTWALAPWVYWENDKKGTFDEFSDYIRQVIQTDVTKFSNPVEINNIGQYIKARVDANRPVTIIDVWGLMLGNRLLSKWEKPYELYLADVAPYVKSGKFPTPIMTAVNGALAKGTKVCPKGGYEWFEFTPFEVGSSNYFKAFVPTSAAGRDFDGGVQKNQQSAFAPMSLDFMMGIFGSAFAVSIGDIWGALPSSVKVVVEADAPFENIKLPQKILALRDEAFKQKNESFKNLQSTMFEKRIVPGGVIWNPAFNLAGVPEEAQTLVTLEFADAGMGGGLPYAPLVRAGRNIDVIIMCDASESVKGAPALKAAYDYAKKKNTSGTYDYTCRPGAEYPFPAMSSDDWARAGEENISVFLGERTKDGTTIPTIIYIPRIKNAFLPGYQDFNPDPSVSVKQGGADFSNTMKFKYAPEDFNKLSGYWEQSMIAAIPTIVDAIKTHMLQ